LNWGSAFVFNKGAMGGGVVAEGRRQKAVARRRAYRRNRAASPTSHVIGKTKPNGGDAENSQSPEDREGTSGNADRKPKPHGLA
jgi:hypothetical protein